MADVKISELTALASASVDVAGDVLAVVDTSATQTKKIAVENLLSPITINKATDVITNLGAVTTCDINGGTIDGITSLTGGTGDLNWDSNTLVVDSSANSVGIGVAAPAEILHLKKTATDSNVILKYGNDARDWMLGVHGDDSDKFKLETHDKTDVVVVTSAGNVGIGISAPAYALDILNSTTPQLNISNVTTDNTVKVAQITCSHYDNEDKPMTMMEGRVDGTNNYVRLGGGRSEGTSMNIMEWYFGTGISHDGGDKKSSFDKDNVYFAQNVGIGDSDPSEAKLSIDNVLAGDRGLNIVQSQNSEALFIDMNGNNTALYVDTTGSTGRALYCYSNQGASQGDPLVSFTVDDSGFDHSALAVTNTGVHNAITILNTGTGTAFYTSQTGSGATAHFETNASNSVSGMVLMQNSHGSDPFGLKIDFSNAAPNNTGTEWFIYGEDSEGSEFNIWADGSFVQTSDRRRKENIADSSNKLNQINQLRVVDYNRIGDTHQHLGLISQEVEEIFPHLVSIAPDEDKYPEGEGGTKMLYKIGLIPILVKAVQELSDKLDTANAKITALENA
jgi:hypothetical protein